MPTCPSCGQQSPDGFRFCGSCGAPLEAREAREERKVVTVLFADLVGFTARAETLDPEDVRALLTPYHVVLRTELERHGGTVEKFIGDAVMALFGAPVAHEDDPERAVRAALAIRDWIAGEGDELRVRIAVNTGEALVTVDARPGEGESMTAGDVVNTAARLQAAAPVNGILVGETTYRTTRHAIDYREANQVLAKGKREPIPVWEAVEARSRLGVDLGGAPRAPLVGRDRELSALRDVLSRARSGSPQLVTLLGVPGIGKSRLVWELFQAVEAKPELITWRQGRCLPYGDGVSFWALGEMVKGQAGILENDSDAAVETKLHASLEQLVTDAEARWIADRLRALVGAGAEELLVGDRRGETFAAWRRYLEALAEQGPTVLVFEDLHWADDGLLEFVDDLVDRVVDVALLVLCTARPELLGRRPGWGGGKTNALTISLPPISDEDTARLVAALLERPLLPAETQTTLLTQAGGNPLYAEQYVRMLVERGHVDELPETVHGIIAARVDALSPDEKQLLLDAAVVGKVFWRGALTAIGEVSDARAEELLHRLERKEFVQRARRSSVADEVEYAFRHVLLRDVAYAEIPHAARARKHRLAAAWIESLGRLEDHSELLADHYVRALQYGAPSGAPDGEVARRAREALARAADRAWSLGGYVAAARLYGQAIDLCPTDDPERPTLLLRQGRAEWFAHGGGLDHLTEALDKLRAAGDDEGAAEAARTIGHLQFYRGDRDDAYRSLDEALDLLAERPASPEKAAALLQRGGFHMVTAEYDAAISLCRQALPMTERPGLEALRARALNVIGVSRVAIGDEAGIADLEASIAIAREAAAFEQLLQAEENLRSAFFYLGRLREAAEVFEDHRPNGERFGIEVYRRWVLGIAAAEAYLYGRWTEALETTNRFLDGQPHYLESLCHAIRALVRLGRDDLSGASEDSTRALADARRTKDFQVLVPCLYARAHVAFAEGLRDEAVAHAVELGAVGDGLAHNLGSGVTLPEIAWTLHDAGLHAELESALRSMSPTPWVEVAQAIGAGDAVRAAQVLERIGALTAEAYTRLRAAESLPRNEAAVHLAKVLDFYRRAGATRYVAQAESLLGAYAREM